jgi:hypothetical protein
LRTSFAKLHRQLLILTRVDPVCRITKAGDAMVRTALYEAANVLLTRAARWSPLKAWAVRLAQRIGGKRAKVALARKLAVLLHRIWIEGTTFTWTRERAMAAI